MKKNKSNIIVWRYLSLPKFLDFVLNKNIAFTRADMFCDKKEGVPNDLLHLINVYEREKEKYSESLPNFPFAGIGNPVQGLLLHKLSVKEKRLLAKLTKEQKMYFVSSWFKSEHESMAMWNLYSENSGVAIKTTVEVIINFINSQPFFDKTSLSHNSISYNNISRLTNDFFTDIQSEKSNLKLFYRKDISFEHEKEYRFVLFDKNGGSQIPIRRVLMDGNELNKFQIITHPLMPNWQFENLKQICIGKIQPENFNKSSLI
jgi:hypothetical protein